MNSKGISWISKILFCYVNPYLRTGKHRELNIQDFKSLPRKCHAEILKKNLEFHWNHCKPNLTRSLILTFWKSFVWSTCLGILKEAIFRVAQGPALGFLIDALSSESTETETKIPHQGLYAGIALVLSLLIYTLLNHYSMFLWFELGMRMRVGLTMLIYNKTLKIDQRIIGSKNIGKITTLVTNDANRFDRNIAFITYLIIGPVQVITVTAALWFYVGPITFALPLLLGLLVPFQGWIGKKFGKLRLLAASYTDKRVRIINEIINAIKLIKMNTWEHLFLSNANDARKTELKKIKSKWNFDAFNKVLFDVSSKLIVLCVLALYIVLYRNSTLSPTTVFVTLTLTNYLRTTITNYLPMGISGLYEVKVSIQRIRDFLLLEERKEKLIPTKFGDKSTQIHIKIENYSTGWTKDGPPVVQNVSFTVNQAQLTVLSGPVGSGKSTLICGILGELDGFGPGKIQTNGTIAYASQDPWIFAGTVRENILFGRPYIPTWYEKVLIACGLEQDLSSFGESGDETQVGEKGVALSGGQQARINLARAIYGNSDIVILDDPLAAVDVKTGRWIYEQCIQGLLKSKTVLLVSNNLQLCSNAHQIILLKDGKVVGIGKYGEIEQFLEVGHRENLDIDFHSEDDYGNDNEPPPKILDESKLYLQIISSALSKTGNLAKDQTSQSKRGEKSETKTTGIVSIKIYWKYFICGNGIFMLCFFLASAIGAQVFSTGSDYWLKLWSDAEIVNSGMGTDIMLGQNRYLYIEIYAGILIGFCLLSFLRNTSLVQWSMNSSEKLHQKVLNSLVHTSIVFYEQNSSGRILNRVINDIGNIDDNIPRLMQLAINSFFQILGSICLTCFIQPILIPFAILLLILVHYLRNYYLITASQIKRTESIARSPMLAHINTTVAGLGVIRSSCGSETYFLEQFIQKQNQHSNVFWISISSVRWFSMNADWIANGYFLVLMAGIWGFSTADGSTVGLEVSTVLMLTTMFALGISQLTNLDNEIIAVERVLEYIDLPSEQESNYFNRSKMYPFYPTTKQLAALGSQGKIQALSICVTLNENPILKDISFTINPSEKIGIVGRTGAGKTTLVNSLYRLVELSFGILTIDNIDISKLKLYDLRKKLTIIPQVPQLFIGTIRSNLDPKFEKADGILIQALKDVQLWDRLENGLETLVSEGGNNFSTGERQLLCLARALQHQSNILLLDEPTANVDSETEGIINRIVKERFEGCTILTIAHRLDTVIESDRLMVLDKGELVEFDSPYQLFQNPNGTFYQMVKQVKGRGLEKLYNLARNAYFEKKMKN